MRRKSSRRVGLLVAALLLMAVGPLAGQASASHFRHGNLNWQETSGAPTGSQRITAQYEQSWRWSYFGNPAQGSVIGNGEGCINWGDNTDTCPQYLVEFVNAAEDYMRIQALAPGSTTDVNVPHDYADPAGVFTITTGSCCTISSLNNANDSSWNILSVVDLDSDDESAVSTIPAIVTLAPGGVRTFNVPAGDAGGETLFFRLSTAAESCAGCGDPHPPGISINSSTGQVTLDTTGLDGLNWTGVVIESRGTGGNVVSTSHIQYIIKVAATGGNNPPVWDSPPTPADGTVYTVAPGNSVNFSLQASDPDSGDTVSILKNSGPGTFTPTNGNPATGSYSFTATNTDLGNDYIVQFIAQDQDGDGPPFRSYTIKVRSAVSTEGPVGDPSCSDNVDNDGDGQADANDSDCQAPPSGGDCDGKTATITGAGTINGTPGNDVIVGSAGPDTINGGGGNDTICGRGGNDTISGGAGNDSLFGEGGDDKLDGNTGDDKLDGGSGKDTLEGKDGNDRLEGRGDDDRLDGGNGMDVMFGQDGNDYMRGGADDDQMYGGPGNDQMFGDAGNDTMDGGSGDDYMDGGSGNDTVFGQGGKDTIHGQGGNDQLNGGAEDDYINGGDGDDLLSGNTGNDRLVGGDGSDRLNGGDDDDSLRGDAGAPDTCNGGAGTDTDLGGCETTTGIP